MSQLRRRRPRIRFAIAQVPESESLVRFVMPAKRSAGLFGSGPLTIATTTFDGREPIPGVDLDVGKPIISTRRLETSITLTDGGETSGIVLPGPTGRQPILFISVRRVSKDGRNTLPNPVTDAVPSPVPSPVSKPK